jgi:methylamine---glutamate N-methyltransferase subunit B
MDDPRPSQESLPTILVAEIRDYARINAELSRLLDEGYSRVRLGGVEGQRMLVCGLRGTWNATVDIEGNAGPELAADLDAPHLTVVASGAVGDGAGRGLRSGRLLILQDASDALGYCQCGGTIVVAGTTGSRAGLGMSGGTQLHLGGVGRLAGDRQSGGRIFVRAGCLGPFAGRGHCGGRLIQLAAKAAGTSPLSDEDRTELRNALGDSTGQDWEIVNRDGILELEEVFGDPITTLAEGR